jgi:hypothetical protein
VALEPESRRRLTHLHRRGPYVPARLPHLPCRPPLGGRPSALATTLFRIYVSSASTLTQPSSSTPAKLLAARRLGASAATLYLPPSTATVIRSLPLQLRSTSPTTIPTRPPFPTALAGGARHSGSPPSRPAPSPVQRPPTTCL